jgi:hypothetical protein
VHTPRTLNFYSRNLWLFARFENITLKLWNFYSVDGVFPQVHVTFVMSAYKFPGSLFIGVCVCMRPYDTSFPYCEHFSGVCSLSHLHRALHNDLARCGEVINFTHSADETQQMVYIPMFIDIQIAHYGCFTMSENCHVLCPVM